MADYWFNIKRERDVYLGALRNLLRVEGDHMTACDRTMGATHPCTCGANAVRRLLSEYLSRQRENRMSEPMDAPPPRTSDFECSWPECGCQDGCAAEQAETRAHHICEECELPVTSEAHKQHCPEAIRG